MVRSPWMCRCWVCVTISRCSFPTTLIFLMCLSLWKQQSTTIHNIKVWPPHVWIRKLVVYCTNVGLMEIDMPSGNWVQDAQLYMAICLATCKTNCKALQVARHYKRIDSCNAPKIFQESSLQYLFHPYLCCKLQGKIALGYMYIVARFQVCMQNYVR